MKIAYGTVPVLYSTVQSFMPKDIFTFFDSIFEIKKK